VPPDDFDEPIATRYDADLGEMADAAAIDPAAPAVTPR